MKKVLIVIVMLAILGGGAYLLLRTDSEPAADTTSSTEPVSLTEPQQNTEPSNTTTAEEVTVKYNGTAFSPATVTVKSGTKVKFVNESSGPMWVASDPHPVHTDFADFDAERNYTNGQTYEFTFSKAGEFEYHNHSNPGATGTVVVE